MINDEIPHLWNFIPIPFFNLINLIKTKNQKPVIFASIQIRLKGQYLFYLKRRKNDYNFVRKFLFDYFILNIYTFFLSFRSSKDLIPSWSNLSSLFLCFSLPRETATRESNGFKNLRRRASLLAIFPLWNGTAIFTPE